MDNFSKGTPIIASIRAAIESAQGDNDAARETMEHCARNMAAQGLEIAEGLPVVGHITAGVYAAVGDHEGAVRVAEGATRGLVVAAAGFVGGPGAAIAAGVGFDGLATVHRYFSHGRSFDFCVIRGSIPVFTAIFGDTALFSALHKQSMMARASNVSNHFENIL